MNTTEDQFDRFQSKFAAPLRFLEERGSALQALNVQDGRLMVRAVVASEGERDEVVERFRKADPSLDDVHLDLRIDGSVDVPHTGQSTVQNSQSFSQTGEDVSTKDR